MTDQLTPQTLVERADLLRPAAIRAAATLRIADHISAGATTAEQLAGRCGTRADVTELLLSYLAEIGLLRHDQAAGSYALAEAAEPLRDDHPQSVRAYLSADGLFGRAELAFADVLHTVRTGEPAHVGLFGCGYWESVNQQPEFADSLASQQIEATGFDSELIIDGYDWSKVRHVYDIGGHTGAMTVALLRRHPHLRATLVDLKNASETAGKHFARLGLADRAEAVVGSFFEPLPTGGDVYLLSAILADWPEPEAVEILRRCGEAAGPAGRVLLAEVNLAPPAAVGQAAYLALYLRAMMPAPVRSVDQLKELGRRAGLRVTWQGPATPVRSLLEFAR